MTLPRGRCKNYHMEEVKYGKNIDQRASFVVCFWKKDDTSSSMSEYERKSGQKWRTEVMTWQLKEFLKNIDMIISGRVVLTCSTWCIQYMVES